MAAELAAATRGHLAWLVALTLGACYRETAPLATPEARLRWARGLVTPTPLPAEREACGTLADEGAIIARAVARSPRVAALEGEARSLRAAAEVSFIDSPTLRLDNVRLDEVIDGPGRFELGLRVPLSRPGTLDAQADALRHEALAAEAEAREEARRVTLEVRVALARHRGWLALAVVGRLDAAEARAELERLRAGVAKGQALAAELALAELRALEAEGEAARAVAEAARFLAAVTTLTGGDCAMSLAPLSDAERADDTWLARDALVDEALSQRPSVSLRAAAIALASARGWEARAGMWPWLSWAQVGYELTDEPSPRTWIVSIGVDLPIGAWDGAGLDAAARESEAAATVARREIEAIVAEVDAALAEVTARREQLDALERSRARFDATRLAELELAATAGQLDPSELVRLRRELRQLERRRIEAQIGWAEARARLLAAIAR